MPDFLLSNRDLQLEWGAIATMCCGLGDRNFRISHMYIEFENVADPDDVVTAPDVARDDGQQYFQNLDVSANRDFLRVPLLLNPTVGPKAGYEAYFRTGLGNMLTFYAQTQGTIGVHGKPFSHTVNSKVFGVALVATPVPGDASQDLVFARGYLETAQQVVKLPSSSVGMTFSVYFE